MFTFCTVVKLRQFSNGPKSTMSNRRFNASWALREFVGTEDWQRWSEPSVTREVIH